MIKNIILKIKRKENRFYSWLYHFAMKIQKLNFPTIRFIHLPLYYLDSALKSVLPYCVHICWSIPLFKARCHQVGKKLRLPNGIPLVIGSHLQIRLGDNVTIGRSTIGAAKVFESPVLKIGSNSHIGYGTVISVSKEVEIGENSMIGPNCIIMDSDDHPVQPERRLLRETVNPEDVLPVRIGNNVWVGSYCAILKGVSIGDNSVIATHSVVAKNVLPNCVYAGNPARPTLRDINKMS